MNLMPVNSDLPPARPFLKWAGGKGQLLEQLQSHLPSEMKNGAISRYVEPFVGSGALFFKVRQSYAVQEYLIADINPELILVYRTVKKDVEGLIKQLGEIDAYYQGLDEAQRQEYYYQIRASFNDQRGEIQYDDYHPNWVQRAAYMIFLNRTGYNGLFRVNSKGEFNVPVGRYRKPRILDAENLRAVSNLLRKVAIQYCDFESVANFVDQKSMVYFDPPYRPLSATSSFTSYSKTAFDDREQLRLAAFYRRLDAKGGKLMLSNSDPHNTDPGDDFFEQAYAGFRIERVRAKRNINRDPQKRGPVSELLIMNYD
jgi:DNA adenine methylase